MPWQEVASIVDLQRLLDMGDNEVVVLSRTCQLILPAFWLSHALEQHLHEILLPPTRLQESSVANAAYIGQRSRSRGVLRVSSPHWISGQ